MTLNQLEPGKECCVTKLSQDTFGRRLLAMGVYPGSRLRVLRNAPLHDPMEVEIDSHFFSIRRAEARSVEVDPV